MNITRDQAYKLLTDNVKNENLIRHCLAVEAAMRALANYFHENEDSWGIAGLLHDADWEITRDTPEVHANKVVEWLEDLDLGDETINKAILAHNHFHNGHNPPESTMEWALFCADELTGLIVATTLVMPNKKLADVEVENVVNKFGSKSFAAAVDREQISLCETELDIPLEEFVGTVLEAMKSKADELGL
jgi:putative nucleotidyltransferase with HDIG domain